MVPFSALDRRTIVDSKLLSEAGLQDWIKIAFLAKPLKNNETVLSDIAPILHVVHISGSICLPKNRNQKKG